MHMYMHELHLHIQYVALKGNSNITNMFLNNYKRAIFVYNVCKILRKVEWESGSEVVLVQLSKEW